MSKTLDLIRNAKPGTMADFRTPDGQIDSVPVEKLWEFPRDIAKTMMRIMDDAPSDHIALKRLDKYAQELLGEYDDNRHSETRVTYNRGHVAQV